MTTTFSADRYLGKRFTLTRHGRGASDYTVIAWDPRARRVRLHAVDGSRGWMPAVEFLALVQAGRLIEAARAGFELARGTRFTRKGFGK